ncbi:2-succinyl-5-enolpyruvyl-6-hydroxy-3-cyclohexene-1-carboxylic-acid synthase [Bradymonadaceae bacterium TMQ3]|uniref:2-succinyl-5-enolpyruvyl-6-hydroxy-3-cyclohexene-1-carboxylate synthase n=1 Tax=Lujinxingia sediminis TaxID=2480984 RepID=A0ABY0CZ09_9DELT|nr:2-succinyl-5-enolpyruvyl-6-hydroxy-3-cyclohexene-1-carboxylic-acid synthase [Lujinxingia sediminis]RDV39139.1 2-succinyl-5-enolpyruvyl-6-hydroxy-3-cyclohexene-1-carboxylic-acid synthase [Bradymonadaceae bacterium TMQ3]RVU48816.1 2-succinyl-5-enolpyruvyl-6-hydroxy-3-cyclohexene-1-carboxylic-acid synthase [Lujinxingia sediminis]TXC78109.1 2-succinyl-5-enolpyruvyl-6-hydroxy-3-cyclohexene-1-carboxylic-acid synthase [Bradymonadales bacterium TMQ1]
MTPSPPSWPNINTLWAHALVDELVRCGLKHVCISPGSRSTPLVVAFANHPDIEDISIIDERQAAFVALGLSLASQKPVALVCTSGTAAAHYYPAICEASSSGVPLIVLTADRPPNLHDAGAPQALDQTRFFGTHVRWFHQVAEPEPTAEKLRYLRALACRAFQRASGPNAGPVHLNLPFRKPLEPTALPEGHRDAVPPTLGTGDPMAMMGRPDNKPYLQTPPTHAVLDESTLDTIADLLANAERPLILAGADHRGNTYATALFELAQRLGAPLIAEPTSGVTRHAELQKPPLHFGDAVFGSSLLARCGQPDLVLRTGKAPLSWAAARAVRSWAHTTTILLSPDVAPPDPDHLAGWHLRANPRETLQALSRRLSLATERNSAPESPWLNAFQMAEARAEDSLRASLERFRLAQPDAPLTAPEIWNSLGELLPEGSALMISNSMPIRDVDAFMGRRRAPLQIFFNRGVNGIDGIVATGLGLALARREAGHQAPTIIALGDVALRHDLSALALARELDLPLLVLVLDNEGGAIFDELPIADFPDVHTRHFLTSARADITRSAPSTTRLHEATSPQTLASALKAFTHDPGFQVLVARSNREVDRDLRAALRADAATLIDHGFQGDLP